MLLVSLSVPSLHIPWQEFRVGRNNPSLLFCFSLKAKKLLSLGHVKRCPRRALEF